MEATTSNSRTHRGGAFNGTAERGRRGHPHVSKNKTWVAESVTATRNGASNSRHHSPPGAEKRERGGYRGGRARGRGRGGRESHSPRPLTPNSQLEDAGSGTDAETGHTDGEAEENPVFDSPEELSSFYREVSQIISMIRTVQRSCDVFGTSSGATHPLSRALRLARGSECVAFAWPVVQILQGYQILYT